MRNRRCLSFPVLLALLCCLPAHADGLQISLDGYDRAFSPNGDGLQDECAISFTVQGEADGIDNIFLGIYASAAIPPQGTDLLRVLHDTGSDEETVAMGLVWDGRDDSAAMLPDGFYYLQLFAAAGDTSAWLSPATQLELNSSGPGEIISLALEPADFFMPLSPGESEFLELRFIAPDFDPATDSASGLILAYNEDTEILEQVDTITLDSGWSAMQGADTAYRLLWDGELAANSEILDGWYIAQFNLADDAGNPSSAQVSTSINLDTLAPTLAVAGLGEYEEGTVFHFRPEDIPATIDILASDRNSALSCSLAIVDQDSFTIGGTLLESDTDGALFRFELPADEWAVEVDSTYYLFFSAADSAGNRTRALGLAKKISLIADATAPPTPSWDMPRTEFVQAGVLLRGACAEAGVDVRILLDGEYVDETPVLTDNTWQFIAAQIFHDQEELVTGTHEWSAYAVDLAGNVSPEGASIMLTYTPGPTLNIPGRWYGREGEAFEINSSVPATFVKIRIYSVDGRLLRILETYNAVDETDFYLPWDLSDEEGRPLMDGLYIVNIACALKSGELTHERKVVAIVRD